MHEGSAWDRSGTTELIGSTRRSRRRLILHLTSQAILCMGLFFKIERVITESTVKVHMKAILPEAPAAESDPSCDGPDTAQGARSGADHRGSRMFRW